MSQQQLNMFRIRIICLHIIQVVHTNTLELQIINNIQTLASRMTSLNQLVKYLSYVSLFGFFTKQCSISVRVAGMDVLLASVSHSRQSIRLRTICFFSVGYR